jgi:hypothetical protein
MPRILLYFSTWHRPFIARQHRKFRFHYAAYEALFRFAFLVLPWSYFQPLWLFRHKSFRWVFLWLFIFSWWLVLILVVWALRFSIFNAYAGVISDATLSFASFTSL